MNPQDLELHGAGNGPVRVRWLGTAGFEVAHEGHVLLVDPYVTRASLAACVAAPLRPDLERIARLCPRADAIVVSHTHFDHALDVPEIARRTGAQVFGARACAALCRLSGVPEAQVHAVDWDAGGVPEAEVGPFRLRFHPSAHSPLLLGRVPFPGEIRDCDEVPMRVQHYRCGAVLSLEVNVAGRKLLHLGSAALGDRVPDCRGADLLLLCVAGWTSSGRLPERLVRGLEPQAVLFSHWDNFLSPVERPAKVLPAIRFGALGDRLLAANRELRLWTLPLLDATSV